MVTVLTPATFAVVSAFKLSRFCKSNQTGETERQRLRGNAAAPRGSTEVLGFCSPTLTPGFYSLLNRRFPSIGPNL